MKQKRQLRKIIVAAVLFASAFLVPPLPWLRPALFAAAYLTVGLEIIQKAVRNIFYGQVFDENFLMAVATVGAILLGEYPEGVAVMLFYQVGEWFQSYAVGKSRKSISAMMDIAPDYANVEQPDGTLEQVFPDDIAVGTVIVVKPGERVPIDGVIVEGETQLDTAALTGESIPRPAKSGDDIISGCINMTGLIHVRTTKPFGESTVARVLELVENASEKKARTENFITRFARVYTPAVTGAAAVLALGGGLVTGAWSDWILRGLTFLVVSCPCALGLATPVAIMVGNGLGAKNGILFKTAASLEAAGRTQIVALDKTGTITEPDMEVENVVPLVGGDPEYLEAVLTAMYGASEPDNATGKAIHELFDGETDWVCEKRIPFSPETKWSGAVFAGQGAFLVGAPEFILAQRYEEYRDTVDGWAEQGCRVLLAARYDGDPVPGGLDPALVAPLALILLSGRIREQAAETFGYFDRQGVTVKVISGDNPHTASLIAARAGIPGADRYIDTSALETDEDFSHAVSELSLIHI